MYVVRRFLLFIFVIAAAAGAREARSATPLTTVRIASGLSLPLYVTAPPGDTTRLFIVEQRGAGSRGRIKIFKNGAILGTEFLTTDSLAPGGEQGLLGLAFAPDYATSGRFYIDYTDSTGATVIARHTVSGNPDVANPVGTRILTIPQPYENHNGGWIAFGPDGYLYIAMGDGGSGGDPEDRAQNLNSLLGKILRIDVSGPGYTSPPTNPFFGATPGLDEIWAFGLRNPWRNSFDRLTNDMVIGDVGQNQREEIDFVPAGTGAGLNYGWRCFEGNLPFAPSATIPCGSCEASGCPKIFPAYEYNHGVGCAVTGGYVYRGCAIPDLSGEYFFADYCTAEIWSGHFQGGLLVNVTNRTGELAPQGGFFINSITSFGEDARGELYICDQAGQVFKIIPAAAVQESDQPVLRVQSALGDTLGSSASGNAILPGIVPFVDAGSRIRGVGYIKNAVVQGCVERSGNCLTTRSRLNPFDIEIQSCVDPAAGTLTRRFMFTNTAAIARDLAYVDVITPRLRGDPDGASTSSPASAGSTAVLAQYDAVSPNRWIVHSGSGSSGVAYSADVDSASQLASRVAQDQPLLGGTSAGPAFVGLALGFAFGPVVPAASESVTVVTRVQASPPTGVSPSPSPPVARGQIRLLSPVPFRSTLDMEIGLARSETISLDVFDLSGRLVRTLTRGPAQAGFTLARWDGRLEGGGNAPSGIYFLHLRGEDWILTRRVALVR
jgi:glucose/arabinose dehydrogenase